MLEKFRKVKEAEIAALKKNGVPPPFSGQRPAFSAALKGGEISVIAEYKRASPSRGVICESVAVDEAARQYAASGASALSILTEREWFGGDLAYIARAARTGLPVLRKDFIFDEIQARESAATPASAILLIVRQTPDPDLLRDLRECAEAYGMEAVVEIFDAREAEIARKSGARIIQANARDLQKLAVDRRGVFSVIAQARKDGSETWIAASGIEHGAHLREAELAGFDAALVGTALMRRGMPGADLEILLGDYRERGQC